MPYVGVVLMLSEWVDFTYDGYTFSMPGEGTILLSELAKKLNLYEKDLDKSFSVKNVKDVSFTDYDLVKVEKQADGDWLLPALRLSAARKL